MLRSDRVSKSQNVHLNDVYLCINNMLRLKSSDVMHISCGRSFHVFFFSIFRCFCSRVCLWNSEIVLQINQKYVTFKIYYDRRRFERDKKKTKQNRLQLKGSKMVECENNTLRFCCCCLCVENRFLDLFPFLQNKIKANLMEK